MNLEPGFFYHIYNRGNDSRQVFFSRENYLFFLKKMRENLSPFVSFVSWCLMPNHFHLIVFVHKISTEISHSMTSGHALNNPHNMTKTRTLNYSIGILLRSYTRAIQKQENFMGSLFQQHTNAKALIDEIKIEPSYWNTAFGTQINISEGKSYLQTCIEYVHQNPVYSGLVKNAEDWEYSSYRDYLRLRDGKLIDYDLLLKEGLVNSDSHAMTSRHSMTENDDASDKPLSIIHSMTRSHTMNNTVIIGIGSNINAEANIQKMLTILTSKVKVLKVSAMIETKPVGIENQPNYTNGAVKIETELTREDLTILLKSIEDQMGRDRTAPKFGPRNIDLDIVVWNDEIVDEDYYTRDFLQKSVAEIS
jgi:putative transposase